MRSKVLLFALVSLQLVAGGKLRGDEERPQSAVATGTILGKIVKDPFRMQPLMIVSEAVSALLQMSNDPMESEVPSLPPAPAPPALPTESEEDQFDQGDQQQTSDEETPAVEQEKPKNMEMTNEDQFDQGDQEQQQENEQTVEPKVANADVGEPAPKAPEKPAADGEKPADAEVAAEAQKKKAEQAFGMFVVFVIWLFLYICVAFIFKMYSPGSPVEVVAAASADHDFKYGAFACCEDVSLCCFACWCGGVRWADNMYRMGYMGFWFGLSVFLVMHLANGFLQGGFAMWVLIAMVLTYFRQEMRKSFNLKNDHETVLKDLCLWCCCALCAIVQETRQLDDAPRKKDDSSVVLTGAQAAEEA